MDERATDCISASGSMILWAALPPFIASRTKWFRVDPHFCSFPMSDLRTFDQIGPDDADDVGGKGVGLAVLLRAGLPVPPGFCVTTAAYRRLKGRPLQDDRGLTANIANAYRDLGGGPVAVRSSATTEDGTAASFAGQQETMLGVTGERAVVDVIAHCWASLDSARARAYRSRQGIEGADIAMGVVVQRLVPALVSGVLFTRDPHDPQGLRMLIEASWGLGESIVSGRVNPDRYLLEHSTGAVLERHIGTKNTMTTMDGTTPVALEKQTLPCLDDRQLEQLAVLGRQIEALYGGARDVEWAWADGRFWILQARPITAATAAEREQVRREEIAALLARADPRGTVWSRYNLSEVLPAPTPMTWAIVGHLMSGRGGFGMMYRDLGCTPDPALDAEGVFDLVCGRPYCNLSREPRMQFCGLPLGHSFAALKSSPEKALYPTASFNPAEVGPRFWLVMPLVLLRLFRFELRLKRLARTVASELRERILPVFAAEVEQENARDLTRDEAPALIQRLHFWTSRTLVDFARESLKPTALAAVAMAKLQTELGRRLGPDRARADVSELAMGVRPDPEADLPSALRQMAEGQLDRATFLTRFGHRSSNEMELSQPRWIEDPTAVDLLVSGQPSRVNSPSFGGSSQSTPALLSHHSPLITRHSPLTTPSSAWDNVCAEAKLSAAQRRALEPSLHDMQTYLGLRETAKHYLMKGYAVIRQILLELDRRYKLDGGIFYLTPEELPPLTNGQDFSEVIARRRRRRTAALSIDVPAVIFSDDLDAIGREIEVAGADTLQGVPVSAGVAEGPALVLEEPDSGRMPLEPYILVCPSTDPAWVPLFIGARGLVMETGGILSHGAIVAREFGLPAVAGVPNAVRRIQTGQRLRVDGGTGKVVIEPHHA
jgi:pyruvate,water dikinase